MSKPNEDTPLGRWLRSKHMSANRLAKIVNVSPNTIYNLVSGETDAVMKSVLLAVSRTTGITIESLVVGYEREVPAPCDTGDKRVNDLLDLIARYLHRPEMETVVAPWIHDDFRCSGVAYQGRGIPRRWVSWSDMCASNTFNDGALHIETVEAWWWTPDGDTAPHDSRDLFTWQLNRAHGDNRDHDMTLATYRFEKSVNELEPDELPQIMRWWWHSPRSDAARRGHNAWDQSHDSD